MYLTGCWSAAQTRDALSLAMGGCQQLRGVMRQTLLEAAAAAAGTGRDEAEPSLDDAQEMQQ